MVLITRLINEMGQAVNFDDEFANVGVDALLVQSVDKLLEEGEDEHDSYSIISLTSSEDVDPVLGAAEEDQRDLQVSAELVAAFERDPMEEQTKEKWPVFGPFLKKTEYRLRESVAPAPSSVPGATRPPSAAP